MFGAADSLESMAPSYDFRTTVDTARYTKAIYYAPSDNQAFTADNEISGDTVTFKAEGFVLPIRVKAAVTITGYDVVYLY